MSDQPPIRVAHLIGSTGMYGAERWILAQLRYLDRRRCRAVIINLVDTPGENSAIVADAKKLRCHAVDFYTGGRFNPLGVLRLARFLRQSGFGVVHTHGYKSDVIGLLAGRLAGAKVISTPHGWDKEKNRKLALYEALAKGSFKFIDRVCPLSLALYDGLVADGMPQSKLTLILNGVDIKEIDDAPAKSKASGKQRIGYIGQFNAAKGLDDLVETFFRLKRNDCELFMIGDGPCRESIVKRIAAHNGHGGIVCSGYVTDRLAYLKTFDVFVLPSFSEGIPRCVMEAQVAGVPVVATDIDGVRDLVQTEETGLLVPPGNPAALAAAIGRILDSPELAPKLAAAARARVEERFSAARMAAEYEDLYRSLAAQNRERGWASESRNVSRKEAKAAK